MGKLCCALLGIMVLFGWVYRFYPDRYSKISEMAMLCMIWTLIIWLGVFISYASLVFCDATNKTHRRIARKYPYWWACQISLGIALVAIPLLTSQKGIFGLLLMILGIALNISACEMFWLVMARKRVRDSMKK